MASYPWLKARCTPETIAKVTAPDGHIYQVPWKVNPIRMSYRVDAFPEGAPHTYDEYLAAAKRLKADRDGDGYVDTYVATRVRGRSGTSGFSASIHFTSRLPMGHPW